MTKVIAILDSAPAQSRVEELKAFRSGLMEAGCVEGKDFTIQHHSANNDYSKLPGLADELVRRKVDVIVAAGGPASAAEAQKATKTIPIVFTTVDDPRKRGFVQNLDRPEANLTGTWGLTSELDVARLRLLHELLPPNAIIWVLFNPNRPDVDAQKKVVQAAAGKIGRTVQFHPAGSESDILAAKALKGTVDGLLVTADPLFNSLRAQVVALADHLGVPAVYQWRGFVAAGGLVSLGTRIQDAYRQAGDYACRLLKGAQIADLPVRQSTEVELVINPEAEKKLGLKILSKLLGIAP